MNSANNSLSLFINCFTEFPDAEELSSRLMHTIIDIRNDENGRVVLAEARKDKIENPLNLRCIYFEELLSESHFQQLNLRHSLHSFFTSF